MTQLLPNLASSKVGDDGTKMLSPLIKSCTSDHTVTEPSYFTRTRKSRPDWALEGPNDLTDADL